MSLKDLIAFEKEVLNTPRVGVDPKLQKKGLNRIKRKGAIRKREKKIQAQNLKAFLQDMISPSEKKEPKGLASQKVSSLNPISKEAKLMGKKLDITADQEEDLSANVRAGQRGK